MTKVVTVADKAHPTTMGYQSFSAYKPRGLSYRSAFHIALHFLVWPNIISFLKLSNALSLPWLYCSSSPVYRAMCVSNIQNNNPMS
jgi:hypothetical protein